MGDHRLRDLWLSEMWKPCREESREEREVKRALDAAYASPVDNGPGCGRRAAS